MALQDLLRVKGIIEKEFKYFINTINKNNYFTFCLASFSEDALLNQSVS